jgi:hypothetical protein
METPQEEWRPCSTNHRYEVSDLGRFRNSVTHEIKSCCLNRKGRKQVTLYIGRHRSTRGKITYYRTYSIAPWIARAFLGEPPIDANGVPYQVDHIDGIKTNDRADNLQYVTGQYNVQAAYDNNQHPNRPYRGAFMTEGDYEEIRSLSAQGYSQVKIAKIKGINNSSVCKILAGKCRPRVDLAPHILSLSWEERGRIRQEEARVWFEKGYKTITALAAVMRCSRPTAIKYLRILR